MNPADITRLLAQAKAGDPQAWRDAVDLLYPALKSLARGALARCDAGKLSLSTTDLVHELYLKVADQRSGFANRAHFLAIAAQSMRRVLVDLIRERAAEKRGADLQIVPLHDVDTDQLVEHQFADLHAVLDALTQLETLDPRAAMLVELRIFGGLSNDQAAEVLAIGSATAGRDFAFARAWLAANL